MPSCAMIAMRLACALVRAASVATMAMVVFSARRRAFHAQASLRREGGGPAAAAEFAVALIRRGPEIRRLANGRLSDGIDRDQRADAKPSSVTALAEPSPPLRSASVAP